MRGNPGRMYETKDGDIIIAYHKDQQDDLYRKGQIVIWEVVPGNTLFQEMNNQFGTTKKVTKRLKDLKLIGFID